jgi:hypothetical protein
MHRAVLVVAVSTMLLFGPPRAAHAVNHLMVIDEILGSWQGNSEVQFIELRMLAADQNSLQLGASIEIFDKAGELVQQLSFLGPGLSNLPGTRILIGTSALSTVAGIVPDFPLAVGILPAKHGRVCYRGNVGAASVRVDCVAYGKFEGDNETFGDPSPVTPDNRSLQRARDEAEPDNASDFVGELRPTPENSAGQGRSLVSLCGNEVIDAGEDCDGDDLDEQTCQTQGFAMGDLDCSQCHFDTSACSDCGNGEIDNDEPCDGANLDGRSCSSEGFTSGTLACAFDCTLDTTGCAELQIPGSGPDKKNCYAQWSIVNPDAPLKKGLLKTRQRCVDGDTTCDFDGVVDGVCTFHVRLCFNRVDDRVAKCAPRGVSSVAFRQPSPASADPSDQENAGRLLAAVAALGSSTLTGASVAFSPALETVDVCTDLVDVRLPVRAGRGRKAKAGKSKLRTIVADGVDRRRDKDTIVVQCQPGG